jgi:hypothetical protein
MKPVSQRHRPAPMKLVTAALALTATMSITASGGPATTEPLLQRTDIHYVGAFRVPNATYGGSSFHYAGNGLAFNPTNGSLFISGSIDEFMTAEISVPTPSASGSIADLPVASVLQAFVDPSEGKSASANCGFDAGSPLLLGGYLVFNGKLYFDGYRYYDGSGCQTLSHFARPLNLSVTGQVLGPAPISNGNNAGPVSGPMALIPPEWQTLLGGPAVTSQCCIPIPSRSSFGPDFFVWDPNSLSTSGTPSTALLYYNDQQHWLSAFDRQSSWYNGSSHMHGVVFPSGTRSVLYFGRQGLGPYCYGPGTSDLALAGTLAPSQYGGELWCYDPTDPNKGNHAYPYISQVWAYDANDLLAVKQGLKQPWDPRPYATWSLASMAQPFFNPVGDLNGAAYDPATGRIFVMQPNADGTLNDLPVIYVFALGPAQPTNVRIVK